MLSESGTHEISVFAITEGGEKSGDPVPEVWFRYTRDKGLVTFR